LKVFLLTGRTDLDALPLEYSELRRLIRRCASGVPESRPSMGEVIERLEEHF